MHRFLALPSILMLLTGCDGSPASLPTEASTPLFQQENTSPGDPGGDTTVVQNCQPGECGLPRDCEGENAIRECENDWEAGGGGSNFFNDGDSNLYEAPGDPSPGAAGVWLGSDVSPSTCFVAGGGAIVFNDSDGDGLADHCEFPIARSFAPMLNYNNGDSCPDGEPYWAARRTSGFYNDRVFLAYLFSYYSDCGYGGHAGDSEAVLVLVKYNTSTQHWEFEKMWTSAHYQAGEGCSDWYDLRCDFSEWSTASQTTFVNRYLAYPDVWVAVDKHANYRSDARCDSAAFNLDDCGSLYRIRTPVYSARNIGSQYKDLAECVGSIDRTDTNGRTECFYTYKEFRGWYAEGTGSSKSAGPYRTLLMREFESQ